MRLNPDCIRQILFAIESETDSESGFYYRVPSDDDDAPIIGSGCDSYQEETPELSKPYQRLLKKYSSNEIVYHLRQCKLAGLFLEYRSLGGEIYIRDLMPAGHDLLSQIRSENVWRKVKEFLSQNGASSIGALTQVAKIVFDTYIKCSLPPR